MRTPRRNLPGALQRSNRRRHGVDQAHLIALRQVRQLQGVARHDRANRRGEGDENLPHRQVEAHRRRGQHALQIVFAVDLGGPVNQRLHVAMGNGHAFRFAGGAGGVDHVGQIRRIALRRQIVRRLRGKRLSARLDQHHLRHRSAAVAPAATAASARLSPDCRRACRPRDRPGSPGPAAHRCHRP